MQETEHSTDGRSRAEATHLEEGGYTQSEDINIPMVAVFVALFAVTLAVAIIALQAWFYSGRDAALADKMVAQGGPGTPLGEMLAQQHAELSTVGWNDHEGQGGKAKKVLRVDIDTAMNLIVNECALRKP